MSFFRRWLDLAGDDAVAREAYWGELSHAHRLPGVTAPVLMVGGWYDIFLPWQLHDYATLRAAGANPYLTIGPWTHGGGGLLAESVRESVDWLRAHLRGEPDLLRERPVRLYVSRGRVDPGWCVARVRVVAAAVGRPTVAPTPGRAAGAGPSVTSPLWTRSGSIRPIRHRPSAARCCWRTSPVRGTTAPSRLDPTCSSTPATCCRRTWRSSDRSTATMCVRGSQPYHDVFVRLCDVEPSGRSVNICDGLARLTGAAAPGRRRAYRGEREAVAGRAPVPGRDTGSGCR